MIRGRKRLGDAVEHRGQRGRGVVRDDEDADALRRHGGSRAAGHGRHEGTGHPHTIEQCPYRLRARRARDASSRRSSAGRPASTSRRWTATGPSPPSPCCWPTSPCSAGIVRTNTALGPVPGQGRRRRVDLLPAVGVPALPALRGRPAGRPLVGVARRLRAAPGPAHHPGLLVRPHDRGLRAAGAGRSSRPHNILAHYLLLHPYDIDQVTGGPDPAELDPRHRGRLLRVPAGLGMAAGPPGPHPVAPDPGRGGRPRRAVVGGHRAQAGRGDPGHRQRALRPLRHVAAVPARRVRARHGPGGRQRVDHAPRRPAAGAGRRTVAATARLLGRRGAAVLVHEHAARPRPGADLHAPPGARRPRALRVHRAVPAAPGGARSGRPGPGARAASATG